MDDEQGPWWTRPPEPSAPRPHHGTTAGDAGRRTSTVTDDAPPTLIPASAPSGAAPAPAGPTERLPAVPADAAAARTTVIVPAPVPAPWPDPAPGPDPDPAPGRGSGGPDDDLPEAPGPTGLAGPADLAAPIDPDTGTEGPALFLRALRGRRLPGPRVLAGAAAAVAVVLVVGVVGALTGGDEDPAAGDRAGAPARNMAARAADSPETLTRVAAADATRDLRRAGQAGGKVVAALEWQDDNGRNLVATTSARRPGGKVTLRVVHLAGLDGKARTLRVMQDPDLPQCGRGTAGFTENAFQVRDLDQDGVAEVLVGWTSRCGGRSSTSTVKLALITGGDKYILRGEGVIGEAGAGTSSPEPAAGRWPKEFLATTTQLFREVYY